MIGSYFRIALRNLLKNKGLSFINIFGLTLGIATSLLILLFVFYELSYDQYHENKERVYRLCIEAQIGDTKINQTFTSARNLRELRERCPEIEDAVKFIRLENVSLKAGNEHYAEPQFLAADSSLFDIMSYQFLYGSKDQALNQPNTVVLTKSAAMRYFGKENVVGEMLEFSLPWGFGVIPFEVTGVIENVPDNSHLHFDHVVSMMSFPTLIANDGWSANNFQTYLKLFPGSDPIILESKLQDYVKEYMGDRYEAFREGGGYWDFFLQPITSIHLNSDLNGEFEQNGNKKYIYIFSIIALFVLVIASINFMNLSTAKSALRAREVGIRKLSGSTRGMLIRQFLTESVLISLIALLLAVILTELCLPAFRNLIGKPLSLPLWNTWHWWPILIIGGLVIGLISGLYPAFFLSRYKPARVLKGRSDSGKQGKAFRNTLVIIQFAASIFLIIGTIVIQRQVNFLQKSDIGFDKNDVVVLTLPPEFDSQLEAYKTTITSYADVWSASGCSGLPGNSFGNIGFHSPSVEKSFTLNTYACDEDYLNTLNLEMLEGRFFSKEFATDSAAVVLNETTVKALNLENPLESVVRTNGEGGREFKVIGVVKDYHYESMHAAVRPLGLFLQGGQFQRPLRYLAVKTSPGTGQTVVKHLSDLWNEQHPELVFNYSYLESNYNSLYNNETLTSKIFLLLSVLSILVAAMGLLGLASFIAENRRKEIGIRKVMGASVERIILLLTGRFTVWVFISFVIASPVAWFVLKNWLQGFVYRQELSWWIFPAAGCAALFIALVTISTITWRAASRNPVESLRYE